MAAFILLFYTSVMTLRFHDTLAQNISSTETSSAIPRCSFVQKSIKKSVSYFEISGKWLSKRCEVRPGPQFMLRSYLFRYDGRFVLNHHFYKDGNCSAPLHTVTSHGKIRLNSIRESFRVGGAKDVSYILRKVKVMAHTKKGGKHFRKLLRTKCPFCLEQYYVSKTISSYPVYSSSNNCDCLEFMNFYLGELEIMRVVEQEKYKSSNPFTTELYVGNVKTLSDYKRYYRSSTYQDPVVREKRTFPICDVCTKVALSTDHNPPRLQPQKVYDVMHLTGNWMSVRCEVRPGSTFLTRHLTFLSSDNMWLGYYTYFSDPECSMPKYTLKAFGRYLIERSSPIVPGAFDAQFSANHLFVTSHSEKVTQVFNSYREGRSREIITNEEMDVTNEGGLAAINLFLPNKEYELLKVIKEDGDLLLFTGRRPGIGRNPDKSTLRATSFQDELVLCKDNQPRNVSDVLSNLYWNNSISQLVSDKDTSFHSISINERPESLMRKLQPANQQGRGGTNKMHQTSYMFLFAVFIALRSFI